MNRKLKHTYKVHSMKKFDSSKLEHVSPKIASIVLEQEDKIEKLLDF